MKKHAKHKEGAASTPGATSATATAGYFSTAATAHEGMNTKFTFTPQPEREQLMSFTYCPLPCRYGGSCLHSQNSHGISQHFMIIHTTSCGKLTIAIFLGLTLASSEAWAPPSIISKSLPSLERLMSSSFSCLCKCLTFALCASVNNNHTQIVFSSYSSNCTGLCGGPWSLCCFCISSSIHTTMFIKVR